MDSEKLSLCPSPDFYQARDTLLSHYVPGTRSYLTQPWGEAFLDEDGLYHEMHTNTTQGQLRALEWQDKFPPPAPIAQGMDPRYKCEVRFRCRSVEEWARLMDAFVPPDDRKQGYDEAFKEGLVTVTAELKANREVMRGIEFNQLCATIVNFHETAMNRIARIADFAKHNPGCVVQNDLPKFEPLMDNVRRAVKNLNAACIAQGIGSSAATA